jgi:hypothetical protein
MNKSPTIISKCRNNNCANIKYKGFCAFIGASAHLIAHSRTVYDRVRSFREKMGEGFVLTMVWVRGACLFSGTT